LYENKTAEVDGCSPPALYAESFISLKLISSKICGLARAVYQGDAFKRNDAADLTPTYDVANYLTI
jgi:hypothetical protein